jgi:hypothetical protein
LLSRSKANSEIKSRDQQLKPAKLRNSKIHVGVEKEETQRGRQTKLKDRKIVGRKTTA